MKQVLSFLLLSARLSCGGPAERPENWDALLTRYNLDLPAGWPATAGRRPLETAVDWRSVAAAVSSGQYNQYAAAVTSQSGGGGGQTLLEGTFHMVENNNFERYLEELGVEPLLRQLAVIANPSVTIAR